MVNDFIMCLNHKCGLNKNCKRYSKKIVNSQAYAGFEPDEKGECKNFWDKNYKVPKLK